MLIPEEGPKRQRHWLVELMIINSIFRFLDLFQMTDTKVFWLIIAIAAICMAGGINFFVSEKDAAEGVVFCIMGSLAVVMAFMMRRFLRTW